MEILLARTLELKSLIYQNENTNNSNFISIV